MTCYFRAITLRATSDVCGTRKGSEGQHWRRVVQSLCPPPHLSTLLLTFALNHTLPPFPDVAPQNWTFCFIWSKIALVNVWELLIKMAYDDGKMVFFKLAIILQLSVLQGHYHTHIQNIYKRVFLDKVLDSQQEILLV